VETLGALDGAGAVELLHELGRRITESTRERRATEYLYTPETKAECMFVYTTRLNPTQLSSSQFN